METIYQKTCDENVATGGIHLQLSQVPDSPYRILIAAAWQFSDDNVVVLAVECLKEPHLSFAQRTRNRKPGVHFIQAQSLLAL